MMVRRGLCGVLVLVTAASLPAQDALELTEDSKPQPGVPQGEVLGPFILKSSIYPGTVREYQIYVPKQYDPAKPACVFIVQDGIGRAKGWHIPTVLDNLIHKQEIPVQIGVFVNPGILPAANEKAQPRFNRSFEYDSLGDRYARFLVEELLPEVSRSYNLSTDPNDRALAGGSSGGICSFNAAWERPDQFRRVFSSIGSFVGLRGGHDLQYQVRRHEGKPLRVFLEDGTNDANGFSGNFFKANESLLSSLQYNNYDVRNYWDDGGHDARHSTLILPGALRFLWKGYPEPIAVPLPPKGQDVALVIHGEDWQEVSSGHKFTEGPAVNEAGEIFFSDIPNGKVYRVALDGSVSLFAEDAPGINGLMFGPDGKLYGCENGSRKIVRFAADGSKATVADGVSSNDLVILADGSGYFTDPSNKQVWRFTPDGQTKVVDQGIERPNGIIVSPDQTLLEVADSVGRFTWSFQILPDGTLTAKQQHGWLRIPDDVPRSGADGMTVDSNGNLYVATRVGLQVLDPAGRIRVILNKPHLGPLSNVVFGGPELDTLYVTAGDKVFKRKINAKGVRPFKPPVFPPSSGVGR